MFKVNNDKSIYVTRGDILDFKVTADYYGENYGFNAGDIVRVKVFEKNGCDCVVLQRDFVVGADTEEVDVLLTGADTKIGEVIHKPKDFWYEVELNPMTNPQTLIGYDEDGPKIFRLFPEGADK